jgi:hypothetical protein
MGGNETMTKRFTVDEKGYFDKKAMRYVTIDYLMDLVNEQDQRIKELEEQLKLVCEADCVTPHDSVKEILRDEIKGIDTVAGESAMAWHDYCVLTKIFREQYDNELWDNYDD